MGKDNKNIIKKENNTEVALKRSQSLLDITKDILKSSKKKVALKQSQELSTPEDEDFLLIKAGSFMMGSDEHETEQPIHKVTIEYDFYMSKYQLTFEEYDLFCEATGKEKPDDRGWGRGKRPVINVSWEDAIEYCQWRSQKEGKTYRLPTEAEWEYACRAGTTTRWSFGDDVEKLDEYAWYDYNVNGKSQPVSTKNPNPWGLYDMHGNVWEWCEDVWAENYEVTPRNGSANKGAGSIRVLRGGSWPIFDYGYSRSSLRYRDFSDSRDSLSGFRLVLQRTLP